MAKETNERKSKTTTFTGVDKTKLESNIDAFLESIGGKELLISKVLSSTNPKYVFKTSFNGFIFTRFTIDSVVAINNSRFVTKCNI